jgi:glycosyltransferase involved in cell wall biosynthesis
MRVVYAYENEANDINVQSGRPYSILQQLRAKANRVDCVFPLDNSTRYLFALKYHYFKLCKLTYRPDREKLRLRSLARQIEARINNVSADFLFCPGSIAITELDVDIPKIFCADATFQNVLDSYETFSHCAPEYIAQGLRQEARALANCDAVIYPSIWAARSAIEDFGADPAKVHVVPFGANIETPDEADVKSYVAVRRSNQLVLLFIGREWERKGADIVLAACDILYKAGVPLELHMVGIEPPPVCLPAYVVNHGVLKKSSPQQHLRLKTLIAGAHFLFVPSRAENYGMTFCEAAAFGVPSVSNDVGGIPTIVRTGLTGICLPRNSPPSAYAEAIHELFVEPQKYRELALSSAAEYRKNLNWDNFGNRLLEIARMVA